MDSSAEQTLKQLGIDRWVLRPSSQTPADAADGAAEVAASHPHARAATGQSTGRVVPAELKAALAAEPEPTAAMGSGRNDGRAVPPPANPTAAADRTADPHKTAAADLPACKVLALGGAGALVLSFATRRTSTLRLARDLLQSIPGARPQGEQGVRERVFDWDPSALAAVQVSGRRALTAFAQRQLDDAGARLVLLSSDLDELVPELGRALEEAGAQRQVVPPFALLANDAEAKRQLWTRLQTLKA